MVRELFVCLAVLVAAPSVAKAQDEDADATSAPTAIPTPPPVAIPTEPALHHVPIIVASAHRALPIGARIDRPDLVKHATLFYRRGNDLRAIPFERSSQEAAPYVAVIPEADVAPPGLAYSIEIERTDGTRVAVFATRDDMQPVHVIGDFLDAHEQALLEEVHGRRSVIAASGDYVFFGAKEATVLSDPTNPASPTKTLSVPDQYYRVEGSYTYRILRTVAEFGLRAGVVRGRSVVLGVQDESKFNVGVNYAAPRLRLRATDWLHFEGEFLTSVTEVGFSVGAAGAVIVGDPYATRLTMGFESIQVFGSRGYSRVDVLATKRLLVSPIIEVTNMPHADTAGVRLLTELTFDLGSGFGLGVRGGYQARVFASGGPSGGATLTLSF